MLCEQCQKRPATVHVTKIENNQKTELNLCQVCAHESGDLSYGLETKLTLHNFLSNLLSQDYSESLPQRSVKDQQCNKCGFTLKKFSQLGRLGCDHCYKSLEPYLEPMIRKIHGADCHTGKLPKRIGGSIKLRKDIEQIRCKLQQAIGREEFEQAAQLRDMIKDLEKQLAKEV